MPKNILLQLVSIVDGFTLVFHLFIVEKLSLEWARIGSILIFRYNLQYFIVTLYKLLRENSFILAIVIYIYEYRSSDDNEIRERLITLTNDAKFSDSDERKTI